MTPQERNRAAVLERDRDHEHRARIDRMIERCDSGRAEKITVPVVKVLVPWHTDSTGCRARTVGNES